MNNRAEHFFTPPAGQPWARCVICKLSEAQHLLTAGYTPRHQIYRCPYCVDRDTDPCPHRDEPLGLDAKPLREGAR